MRLREFVVMFTLLGTGQLVSIFTEKRSCVRCCCIVVLVDLHAPSSAHLVLHVHPCVARLRLRIGVLRRLRVRLAEEAPQHEWRAERAQELRIACRLDARCDDLRAGGAGAGYR